MPVGLQVTGSHGVLQIDETYRNLSLRAKGAVSGSVSLASATSPLIAFTTTNTLGALVNFASISAGTYTWSFRQVPTATNYYVFDVPIASSLPAGQNIGFQVFNASGLTVFDTANEYMRVIGTYTLPFPTSSPYLGVTKPVGKTYAFAHYDSGSWHKDNANGVTDLGGYNVYLDSNGNFNTVRSIAFDNRSGSPTNGLPVDDTQPKIIVIDVTGM